MYLVSRYPTNEEILKYSAKYPKVVIKAVWSSDEKDWQERLIRSTITAGIVTTQLPVTFSLYGVRYPTQTQFKINQHVLKDIILERACIKPILIYSKIAVERCIQQYLFRLISDIRLSGDIRELIAYDDRIAKDFNIVGNYMYPTAAPVVLELICDAIVCFLAEDNYAGGEIIIPRPDTIRIMQRLRERKRLIYNLTPEEKEALKQETKIVVPLVTTPKARDNSRKYLNRSNMIAKGKSCRYNHRR